MEKGEKMKEQVMKQRLLKSKKNALINQVYDRLDALRTKAYEEDRLDWFHRMNELCIWVGNQQEFKTWYEEEELDLGPADLGNYEGKASRDSLFK